LSDELGGSGLTDPEGELQLAGRPLSSRGPQQGLGLVSLLLGGSRPAEVIIDAAASGVGRNRRGAFLRERVPRCGRRRGARW
jgi:hypothetical protein